MATGNNHSSVSSAFPGDMPDQFSKPTRYSIYKPEEADLLRGRFVYLQPLEEKFRETLRPLARDERIWEFTKTLLINDSYDEQFDKYFEEALSIVSGGGQAFVIRLAADDADAGPRDTVIGMTRLFNLDAPSKRVEIGYTWYLPVLWGKVHNKECKLLLLQFLFEVRQFNRVEFRVAHQNLRSQRAVEKIGGVKEGVLRKFTFRNDGSVRHTVIFSIIDDEWQEKKAPLQSLVERLAAK